MRYIKTYEYFKPIKINNEKPFKVDDNIVGKIMYLQDSIKKLKKRLTREKDRKSHAELNNEINTKVKRLSDLTFKQTKQASLQNNKITEAFNYDKDSLVKILASKDFKPDDIKNYIDFDEDDAIIGKTENPNYPYNELDYFESGLTLLIKNYTLERLLDIEDGSLNFALELNNSYNNYEYYVDDDEFNYLSSYTTKKTRNEIKKLSKMFDFDNNIDPEEEGKIHDLLYYLNLNSDLDDIKSEIAMSHERASEKAASEALKKLPFGIDNNNKYETQQYGYKLYFDYEDMIKYMKKHKLNVKTIKEYLENIVGSEDLNYSAIEYEDSYKYLDMTDVKRTIENVVDKYVSRPDEIFKIWIENDNLELFQKEKRHAWYEFYYDFWFNGSSKNENLFEMAKLYNGKILKWFESYDFQKELIVDRFEYYDELNTAGILNKEIEKEYEFAISARKFNI